jgi:hypothetical protein
MVDELRTGMAGLLRKAQMEHDADFLKEGLRVLSQALMEMEVQEHLGAARHEERSPSLTGDSATATASAPGTPGSEPWS